MLEFIAALYNEEDQIVDLLNHVYPYVDKIHLCDDGSTDDTMDRILSYKDIKNKIRIKRILHTGLPETVKAKALEYVKDTSWVIMLDADERFAPGVLAQIESFVHSPSSLVVDWVNLRLDEYMDGHLSRVFQKSRLFRKTAVRFSEGVHEDDQFIGQGTTKYDWVVIHNKTSEKQIRREKEYIQTYKKLLAEGKIDEGRYNWLLGLHYFVKSDE